MDERERRRIRDEEHVRILGIGFVVSGSVTALFGLFPLIYVAMGVVFRTMPAGSRPDGGAEELRTMAGLFIGLGLVLFVLVEAFAALKLIAGLQLLRRRRRIFALVVCAVSCLGIPYSTVLGIAGFVVLTRESVRALFEPQGT